MVATIQVTPALVLAIAPEVELCRAFVALVRSLALLVLSDCKLTVLTLKIRDLLLHIHEFSLEKLVLLVEVRVSLLTKG